jgi:hypothetical protein
MRAGAGAHGPAKKSGKKRVTQLPPNGLIFFYKYVPISICPLIQKYGNFSGFSTLIFCNADIARGAQEKICTILRKTRAGQ